MTNSFIFLLFISSTLALPDSKENFAFQSFYNLALRDSKENSALHALYNCTEAIVSLFGRGEKLVFLGEELKEYRLAEMLLNIDSDRVIVESTNLQRTTGIFILFPNSNVTDYDKIAKSINTKFSPKFILLMHRKTKLYYIFDVFVKYRIIDIIALVATEDKDKVGVYTFYPFKYKRCWNAEPAFLDAWTRDGFLNKRDLFSRENKTYDLKECPLKMAAMGKPPELYLRENARGELSIEGHLQDLFYTLADNLNVTIQILVKEHEPTSNYVSEIVSDVMVGRFDLGFGRFSLLVDWNEGVLFSRQTGIDCFTWGVPRRAGKVSSPFAPFVSEFSPLMWGLVLGIAVSFPFLLRLISHLTPFEYVLRHGTTIIFSFATFVGSTYRVNYRTDTVRVFLSHWLMYCSILVYSYQASMGSLVTVPPVTGEIDTTEALLNTNLRLKGGPKLLNVLNASVSNGDAISAAVDRFEVIFPEEFQKMVGKVFSTRDIAVFGTDRDLIFSAMTVSQKVHSLEVLHVMGECVVKSPTSPVILREGSFLEDPVNRILSPLLEGGLMSHWERSLFDWPALRNATQPTVRRPPFTLSRLRGPLWVFQASLALSFLLFLIEFWSPKRFHPSQNLKKSRRKPFLP